VWLLFVRVCEFRFVRSAEAQTFGPINEPPFQQAQCLIARFLLVGYAKLSFKPCLQGFRWLRICFVALRSEDPKWKSAAAF
jgi:hypothetical protein